MDVGAVTDLALRSLPDEPGLQASRQKVREVVRGFATDHVHFHQVAFDHAGRPVAGIAILTAEMPFHEGREAAVMFCYSEHPGAGRRLWRAAMEWFHADPTLKRIRWDQNDRFDERIWEFARRLGMKHHRSAFLCIKGT
ncbi:MAG: hypothetical protein IIZ92_19655 [Aquincola sp.]|nr:hypothetical protein [Aquincola sp.]